MTSQAPTTEDTAHSLPRRSKLNYLSVLILCVTSAFVTASIILIFQYKLGIPFSIVMSFMIAGAIAVLIPLLVTVLFTSVVKGTRYGGYIVFLTVNLLISVVLSSKIF